VAEISDAEKTPADLVRPWVRMLTQAHLGSSMMVKLLTLAADFSRVVTNCPRLTTDLTAMAPVVARMKKAELSEASRAQVDAAIELAEQTMRCMAYFLIHCRRSVFANAILLPTGQLNPDVVDDFKHQGGTMTALAQHLAVYYPDAKLSMTPGGVNMQTVLNQQDMVNKISEKRVRDDKVRVQAEMTQLRRNAFRSSMLSFVASQTEESGTLNTKMGIEQIRALVSQNADMIVNGTPVETALYDLIIKIYYQGEFVSVMYRRLDAALLTQLTTHRRLTEQNVKLIEIATVTRLITEFTIKTSLIQLA